jgi:hypothetical protein
MYTRTDISLEDRLEIFTRFWRDQEDYGSISELAREWRTSRHFIYKLAERIQEAVDWRRPGRKEEDQTSREIERLRQRVRELEADCETLRGQLEIAERLPEERRQRLLLELAMCPVSEEKIARCLKAAFDQAPSTGWINQQINRAGAAALAIMQRPAVREALREAALDEIFNHHRPILTVVDPRTLMAVVPEAAENRRGETWKEVLKQYPNLELAASDQGSGLIKGVELSDSKLIRQADLFHFKRHLHRDVRRLESHCYAAIEEVERARQLIGKERLLESARIQAVLEYEAKNAALDRRLEAFDWLEVIIEYLEEQFSPYDWRRHQVRSYKAAQLVVDEVLELLDQIGDLNLTPITRLIEKTRADLFTYLRVLEQRLKQIEFEWRLVDGSREAVYAAWARVWYWQSRCGESEENQQQYLVALSGLLYWDKRVENASTIGERVVASLNQVVRASSAAECINSILRPYFSVKKHISQQYLALIALYWDMRPLKNRGGQTPFEASGVDLGTNDWIELLEIEMRKMPTAKRAA